MKRILSILLVAILCLGVLTGCQVLDKVTGTVGGWFGQEQANEDTGLAAADVYLHNLYSKKDGSSVTTDFDVVGRVPGGEGKFLNVTWTCDDASIVIRESTTQGFYTVDLPAVNNEEFTFTLTATITDEKGETKVRSYTFKMLKIDSSAFVTEPVEGVDYKLFLTQGTLGKRYYALATTQNGENKFINTTSDPKAGVIFHAEKVDGGYKFYTEVNGVKNYIYAKTTTADGKVSKYIGFSTETGSVFTYNADMGGVWTVNIEGNTYGVGTYNSFNTISISDASYFTTSTVGSTQFVMQVVTAEYANSQEEDQDVVAITDAKVILEKLYALEDGKTEAGKFILTGKITALDSYGNPTIVVEGYEDKPVLCYKLTDSKFVVDAIITVEALVLKNYKGTFEFEQCTLKSFTAPGAQPPVSGDNLGIIANPEVGTAYKFGLFHGNESANVFFNGENYNSYAWYLAYSANLNDAVDVYLEAVDGVEGAYRLYFMNGTTKTYIRVYQDTRADHEKDGTLELTTSVPTEYFTYSAEYKTLIWTNAIGEQTYLGSSGTYKSISCSHISYITKETSYIAHFYGEGGEAPAPHQHNFVNGKCSCGETDPNYVAPNPPADGVYTIPEVLAAAEGTQVTVTGTVKSFKYTWDDNYGNCSPYIVDAEGNELLCFRLSTKVEIGDNITVTGTVAVYNGTNQLAQGCTAVINNGGNGDNGGNEGGNTEVPEGGVYTIPQVLAAAEGTNVIVSGQVIEINEVWNTQYNNMTVTIADKDGNELYVYRMGTQVVAGDFITVTGTVGVYNDNKQIAQGSTAVVTGHEDLVVDANCKTLQFNSAANRTEYTTDKQVWTANGVTLTNTKAASTSNVGDYTAPARIYKSSDLKIECTGMTKIVFHLNSGKPASGLTDSLSGIAGITVGIDGYDITITFDSAVDSFYIASAAAQFRIDSIDVYTA